MTLMRKEHKQYKDWLDPFDFVTDLQDDMNRLFSTSLWRTRRGDSMHGFFAPEIDVTEEENQYLVKADIPGIRKEDLEISVVGTVLTIKGERKEESEKKGKNFYHTERRFGSFQRTIDLPTEVDASQIKATYKEGVLELVISKSESAKPKQIKVEVK